MMTFRPLYFIVRCNQRLLNNTSLISSAVHTKYPIKEITKKEYKTEKNLIYYEDPDNFGTLSRNAYQQDDIEDEDDVKEEQYLQERPLSIQKLTIKQYSDIIKQYLKHKRLKQAIDVLEVRMCKEDRVKPDNYIYNILIGACADFGYTKKAFKLYNDMKRRSLKVTGDTYTCLFNACANSPWKADGLKRAHHLRELMIEKGIEPNLTNYNCMIKAFGRCGDVSTAFKIVDELKSKRIKIRVHTLNFLLQAAISDKENGLRHAIVVWRKMLKLREKPNIYSFNLMLKCVKECNLGSKDDIIELLQLVEQDLAVEGQKGSQKLLESNTLSIASTEEIDKENKELQVIGNSEVSLKLVTTPKLNENEERLVPNLLSKHPKMQKVLSVQNVSTVQDKFAIVGGCKDFLKEMTVYSVKPDIKTFTQILMLLDETIEAENELIQEMNEHAIRADIDFYNALIKKRCLRSDYDSAKAVTVMITEENKKRKKKHPLKKHIQLKYNIMTYGVLAMTCRTKAEAEQLLQDMKEKYIKVNAEILGTLLRQGTANSNFGYVLFIMNYVVKEKLEINDVFLKHLEQFDDRCKKESETNDTGRQKCSKNFAEAYKVFRYAYHNWLKEVNIEEILNKHPWEQFKEDVPVPFQQELVIEEPKRFYKRNRNFSKYVKK